MFKLYSHTCPVYEKIRTKDGTYQLKEVARTDTYAAVQSHRDEVDMYQILNRAKITGNYSQINGNAGVYADIADYPRCFNDAQRLISSVPGQYAALDPSIKGAFKDISDFLGAVANGSVGSRIADYSMKQNAAAAAAASDPQEGVVE